MGDHVIRGVKVLGQVSKNGRRYTHGAIVEAAGTYAGKRINLDHPDGHPNKTRSVKDLFGWLENVRADGDCLRGDLTYNPAHPFAPTVKWLAENRPGEIGLSHNAVGQGETRGGVFVVEKIVEVRSVDLVVDPATTKGLFEAMDPYTEDDTTDLDAGADDTMGGGEDWRHHLGEMVAKLMKDESLDKATVKKKLMAALKLLDEEGGGEESDDMPADDATPMDAEESVEEVEGEESDDRRATTLESENRKLKEKLDAYEAAERFQKRKAKAKRLCAESSLPKELVTDVFLETLAAADSEKKMAALIEDRRRLAGRKPRSAGSGQQRQKPLSDDEFLSRVTGGSI